MKSSADFEIILSKKLLDKYFKSLITKCVTNPIKMNIPHAVRNCDTQKLTEADKVSVLPTGTVQAGTIVRVRCAKRTRFYLKGDREVTCTSEGTWSSTGHTCHPFRKIPP